LTRKYKIGNRAPQGCVVGTLRCGVPGQRSALSLPFERFYFGAGEATSFWKPGSLWSDRTLRRFSSAKKFLGFTLSPTADF
jgi:hypothetical protein